MRNLWIQHLCFFITRFLCWSLANRNQGNKRASQMQIKFSHRFDLAIFFLDEIMYNTSSLWYFSVVGIGENSNDDHEKKTAIITVVVVSVYRYIYWSYNSQSINPIVDLLLVEVVCYKLAMQLIQHIQWMLFRLLYGFGIFILFEFRLL